jgi:hypothetical protein
MKGSAAFRVHPCAMLPEHAQHSKQGGCIVSSLSFFF